jgi:hypothetical protein
MGGAHPQRSIINQSIMTNQNTLEWVMNEMESLVLENEGELRIYNKIHNLLYHAQLMKQNKKKHYEVGDIVRITDSRHLLHPGCEGVGSVFEVNLEEWDFQVRVKTNAGLYGFNPLQVTLLK